MGLTCAALHLFSPDLSSATPAMSLDQLTRAAAGLLEYERIDNSEEAEHHLVAAVAPPWISFFDIDNPGAITDEALDMGKQYSAASHCPVLLSSVLDSDAFAFLLFTEGKQVDGHASTRGVLPGRIKKWGPERRAREWSGLFGRPISLGDVQSLTEKGLVFADDLLLRLCSLVGLSHELATSTPRDLQARPWPNQQEFFFRSQPGVAGGLPVKQTAGHLPQSLRRSIAVGGEDFLSFELRGPAGAFVDPVLEFSGSAIDASIIALSENDHRGYGIWALGMKAILAGDVRRVHAVYSSEETGGKRVLRACLKGLSADVFGFSPRKQSILVYWATIRGIAVGTGEARVALLPNASAAERLWLRPLFLVDVR